MTLKEILIGLGLVAEAIDAVGRFADLDAELTPEQVGDLKARMDQASRTGPTPRRRDVQGIRSRVRPQVTS